MSVEDVVTAFLSRFLLFNLCFWESLSYKFHYIRRN